MPIRFYLEIYRWLFERTHTDAFPLPLSSDFLKFCTLRLYVLCFK